MSNPTPPTSTPFLAALEALEHQERQARIREAGAEARSRSRAANLTSESMDGIRDPDGFVLNGLLRLYSSRCGELGVHNSRIFHNPTVGAYQDILSDLAKVDLASGAVGAAVIAINACVGSVTRTLQQLSDSYSSQGISDFVFAVLRKRAAEWNEAVLSVQTAGSVQAPIFVPPAAPPPSNPPGHPTP